ncbi:MAG: hypothetical protein QGH45_03320, partial [Myxococcota bacterium]|nr:hypothetical protein [Myxococcota bacterium]
PAVHERARTAAFALVALTLFASGAGCGLEHYASYFDEEPIVALFPGDGAATVPDDTVPWVETSWAMGLTPPIKGTLRRGNGPLYKLDCAPRDGDDMLVFCEPDEPLEWETEYTFQAAWEGEKGGRSSTFYTGYPDGMEYEVGAELHVSLLGDNPLAATAFNTALGGGSTTEEVPLLLVAVDLRDDEELPMNETRWVWGPGKVVEDGEGDDDYRIRGSVGYPFVLPTLLDDDGRLFGSASYAYLPVALDRQWHHVRVDHLRLSGRVRLDQPGMPVEDMQVEGYVAVSSVLRLTSHLDGVDANLLRSLIDLDTDTDGDGTIDSAQLLMSTAALPAAIQQ